MSYIVIKPCGDKYYYSDGQIDLNYYRVNKNYFDSWWDVESSTKRHRLDGPAIEYKLAESNPNEESYNEWWYKGKFIDCSSQQEFERKIKLLAFL